MRHAASRKLHAHWDALRAGRPAPERDEVDPAAIRDVLASVFVIDVAAVPLPRPADATFRLSGTRLDALFCRTLRGSTFDRIWAAGSSVLAAAALDAALCGHPVTAAARGGPPGRDAVALELLLLPLGSRAGLSGMAVDNRSDPTRPSGRFERGSAGSPPRPRSGARVLGALSAATTPDWMGLSAVAALDIQWLGAPGLDVGPRGFGRRIDRPFAVHPGGRDGTAPAAARP